MPAAQSKISSAELRRRLAAVGFEVTAEHSAALTKFVELLLRWNAVYNLTGVRGADEIVDRHLVESFALRGLLKGTQVADVGSGGGLPGVPLAIVEPERRFTLIESRAKRVRFLRHVVGELDLANTSVAHSRAEDLPVERPFDTVLARAVAPPAFPFPSGHIESDASYRSRGSRTMCTTFAPSWAAKSSSAWASISPDCAPQRGFPRRSACPGS